MNEQLRTLATRAEREANNQHAIVRRLAGDTAMGHLEFQRYVANTLCTQAHMIRDLAIAANMVGIKAA